MPLLHKLITFVIFHACVLVLPFEAIANNNIPESLFGVTLGKRIKDVDEKSLNAKKITECDSGFPITRCYF